MSSYEISVGMPAPLSITLSFFAMALDVMYEYPLGCSSMLYIFNSPAPIASFIASALSPAFFTASFNACE